MPLVCLLGCGVPVLADSLCINVKLDCLVKAISTSPCALTDLHCTCSNAKLNAEAEACGLINCSTREGLSELDTTVLFADHVCSGTDALATTRSQEPYGVSMRQQSPKRRESRPSLLRVSCSCRSCSRPEACSPIRNSVLLLVGRSLHIPRFCKRQPRNIQRVFPPGTHVPYLGTQHMGTKRSKPC